MTNDARGESPRDHAPGQGIGEEFERLKERVAFYESFDQLIHENIARSGDLLRQSMELRETAGRELAEARAEAERIDTSHYRDTLSDLLNEVVNLQGMAERLGRRISDAIDEMETGLPAGEREDEPLRLPGGESIMADFLKSPPEYVSFTTDEERAAVPASPPVDASPEPQPQPEAPAEPEYPAFIATPPVSESVVTVVEPEPIVEDVPVTPPEQPRQSMTMLVHGVPRAATALSLQRYLAQLGQVETVEPREYAGGVLRLHVAVREPVSIEDLRGWKEGAGFEPVHARHDLIEVRLPGASGF